MKWKYTNWILPIAFLAACGGVDDTAEDNDPVDPRDACVYCDDKADAFGIPRESYLAYGILDVANTASLAELDDDVPLDVRAARGIVDRRPFTHIEELDTVPYVARVAFNNLANYAQDNGRVPFCGDGGLQPLLEACDDGNDIDGDGCSSTCSVEENTAPNFFDEQAELIKGSDIGVPLVDPNGYYLRERPWQRLGFPEEVEQILERADGIVANEESNDRVSFDELAILSREPFYSSLFQEEKDALADAWELFEVSTAEPVVIEYTGGPIARTVGFDTTIERPGPYVVDSVRDIADLEGRQNEVARRLQQIPGYNADGDDSTVELDDVTNALENLEPVFTTYEYRALERLHELYFTDVTLSSGGDFVVKFATLPNQGPVVHELAEFDGYRFAFRTEVEAIYDADDCEYGSWCGYNFDAKFKSTYEFDTMLTKDRQTRVSCSYLPDCDKVFQYTGVRYMRLNGNATRPGSQKGLMLMEHWEDGERIYNRVLDFKNSFRHSKKSTYHNEYAAARPMVADGTHLSLRNDGTTEYGSRYRRETYQRFKLVEVQTAFNKNVEKFFPHEHSVFENRLEPGRYNEFEGVVIDVHESRAVIAYFDGCELPMQFDDGLLVTEECENSDRHVSISFSNIAATLNVYDNGNRINNVDIYNSNDIYNGYEERLLGRDLSYYIIN